MALPAADQSPDRATCQPLACPVSPSASGAPFFALIPLQTSVNKFGLPNFQGEPSALQNVTKRNRLGGYRLLSDVGGLPGLTLCGPGAALFWTIPAVCRFVMLPPCGVKAVLDYLCDLRSASLISILAKYASHPVESRPAPDYSALRGSPGLGLNFVMLPDRRCHTYIRKLPIDCPNGHYVMNLDPND